MTVHALTETVVQRPPLRDARQAGDFRPEIQGLRAVAVLLVVAFHLWPTRLTGGYVGVDVFFVISGFLITSHMLREVDRTGTLRVVPFWARRIRRLLPASLVVLTLSTFAVLVWVPATLWEQTARQVAASALYVQNWALARDSVDYMAADGVPTVAHHYWSLSVEEQFYLVWPLLLLALVVTSRHVAGRVGPTATAARARQLIAVGIALALALSLSWSVLSTLEDPAFAYLSTLTRVWEFAAGGLAALIGRHSLGVPLRALVGWLGLSAVIVAAVMYNQASLFPGWIALLPVLGTVALVVSGSGGRWTPGTWLTHPIARFGGDISYSVYLWHWPLILLLPFITGRDLAGVDKAVVLVVTVGLAWLTTVFVEDPFRRRPVLAAAPWRAFAFVAAGTTVVLAGTVGISAELGRRQQAAEERASVARQEADACAGPGALDQTRACGDAAGAGPLLVPPEVVVQQNADPPFPGCQQSLAPSDVVRCKLGSTERPDRVVALVGDSHATQWYSAFDALGREHGWKVVTMTKASCPLTVARRVLDAEQTDARQVSCDTWVDAAIEAINADDEITDVFVSAYGSAYGWESRPALRLDDPATDGFEAVWSEISAAGKRVVVIADPPRMNGQSIPNCLAATNDPVDCVVPRSTALPSDVTVQAAEQLDDDAVHVVDLSDRFCDVESCYPVVGGVIVYRDYSHLSAEYATLLAPTLLERFQALEEPGA